MKFLTIIATIFITLSFLAGVYGMNFEYFTEVKCLKISKNHKKHWFSIKAQKSIILFYLLRNFIILLAIFSGVKPK